MTQTFTLQEANEQLQIVQAAEQQPISLQIVVLDDSSSRVVTTLTPAKARPQQHAASAIATTGQGLKCFEANAVAQSNAYPSHMAYLCTPASKCGGRPDSVCATPEARAAAAQLLRGLGMTQGLSLDLGFDLEPEWPTCPPPSLAGSPVMASTPPPSTLALPADLVRTLNMGTTFASLGPELSSSFMALVSESPEQPDAPLPTPAGTPAVQRLTASTLSLGANDIAHAFALAHEQLRTTPVTEHRQCRNAISPVAFALPEAQAAATAADEESPVVKTTRQVSSVLAAVADLEAAQGITCKRVARQVTRPITTDTNKLQTAVEENTTPAHRFSTRFIQSPAAIQAAPSQSTSEPGLSNVANPLFSPVAASLDPMLTPFYTPASMSSIRTGCETPAVAVASGGKASLAGVGGMSPAGVGTPGSVVSTPGSGVVTGDWRSVTDRLQALRAQLQSAQKKLKATSEVRPLVAVICKAFFVPYAEHTESAIPWQQPTLCTFNAVLPAYAHCMMLHTLTA